MRLQYFEQEAARLREECKKNLGSIQEAEQFSEYLEHAHETGQVSNELVPNILALGIIQWILITEEFRQKEMKNEQSRS